MLNISFFTLYDYRVCNLQHMFPYALLFIHNQYNVAKYRINTYRIIYCLKCTSFYVLITRYYRFLLPLFNFTFEMWSEIHYFIRCLWFSDTSSTTFNQNENNAEENTKLKRKCNNSKYSIVLY